MIKTFFWIILSRFSYLLPARHAVRPRAGLFFCLLSIYWIIGYCSTSYCFEPVPLPCAIIENGDDLDLVCVLENESYQEEWISFAVPVRIKDCARQIDSVRRIFDCSELANEYKKMIDGRSRGL